MLKKLCNKIRVFWLYVVQNKTCGTCRRFTLLNPNSCCGLCDRGLMFQTRQKLKWEIPCEKFW